MHAAGKACASTQQALTAAQPLSALQLQGAPACRKHSHIIIRRQLAASFNNTEQLQSIHAHLHSSSRQLVGARAAKPASGLSYSGGEEPGQLLQWSYDEQQEQQQEQQQQQQQRHALHAAEQWTVQQGARKHQQPVQSAQRKDSAASARPGAQPATAPAAPAAAKPGTTNVRRYRRSGQGSGARQEQQQQQRQQHRNHQQSAAGDVNGYAAAQQRVRQLLVSADINNPEAAAAALPDTVNDIVIALQLLATAPKPPGLAAAKQYDAAVQQLAAAVVHKFKLLLLREQQQQQHQQGQQHSQQQQVSVESLAAGNPGRSSSSGNKVLAKQVAETAPCQQAAAAAASAAQDIQISLTRALAGAPATKLAAAAFSLGVLRHYDTQLVRALEQGSLQLMLSSSSSSSSNSNSRTVATPGQAKLGNRQQQQQQQGFRPASFNSNQLGQLAQGFVYLDHELSPAWQAAFLQACRKQMQHMKAPQLASIAAFLLQYRLCSSSSSSRNSAGSGRLLAQLSSTSRLLNSSTTNSSSVSSSYTAATVQAAGIGASHLAASLQQPAAAAAGPSSSDITWQLYSGWSEAYLSAAAQQARALKPQHMVQVLQAAAGLYQQHLQLHGVDVLQPQQQQQQQQQNASDGGAASATSSKQRRRMAAARVFGDLPVTMPAAQQQAATMQASAGRNSSSSSGSMWLLPLLLSFEQQLPEMKMQHLAAVLPALAQLTVLPWPDELANVLLLQLRLLLPAASGTDAVTAAAAAACVAPPGAIAADGELHYALLQRLHAVMSTLTPGTLAAVVQTLAVLQVQPYRAWVYELCARLRVEARNMSAPEVTAVLEGLAALRVQLDPEVLHMFVLGVQRGLGAMNRVDLCRAVAALRRMYPRVLPGRTVAQLVGEMERRAALLELQEVAHR